MEKEIQYYRCVWNHGYGDMGWLRRFVTEEEAIKWFNEQNNSDKTTIKECLDNDYDYYVEEDFEEDNEDEICGDWMQS